MTGRGRAAIGLSVLLLTGTALVVAGTDGRSDADAPASPSDAASTAAPLGAAGALRAERMWRQADSVADALVLPQLEAFEASTAALLEAARDYAEHGDEARLETLRERLQAAHTAWSAGLAFAFGPADSLGHKSAIGATIDTHSVDHILGALNEACCDDDHAVWSAAYHPNVKGLDTIAYLLGRDDAERDGRARRHLARLAVAAHEDASRLVTAWRDGLVGRPPYRETLATAGEPSNPIYPALDAVTAELARGLVGSIEVIVEESLPELIEAVEAADGDAAAVSALHPALVQLRAAVGGMRRLYVGGRRLPPVPPLPDVDVDGEPVGDADALARIAVDDPSGLRAWFAPADETGDARIREDLAAAMAALGKALGEDGDGADRAASLAAAEGALGRIGDRLSETMLPLTTLEPTSPVLTANRTSSVFEDALGNMGEVAHADHELGDEAFEEAFVGDPEHATAGLGPTYNNVSCVSCHIRNGRGMPVPGQLLLRLGDGGAADAAAGSDATVVDSALAEIGHQLQEFGVGDAGPEGSVRILWDEIEGRYPDGASYTLRAPRFEVTLASNGESLPEGTLVSPRLPPPVFGLGLLEAIDEADILALADPEDRDGDGVSGRPNRIVDARTGESRLGRFGWKANSPTLELQTADAYLNDMGITSPPLPEEDGSTEIDDVTLAAATAYSQTLAAPARRLRDDAGVRRGAALFAEAGCGACHVEAFVTGEHPRYEELSGQPIAPYTDLLLHDMGPELADYRPDHEADGNEWRTAPLWGVGLAQTVLPFSGFLHDGRARTLEEAVLWHGGEAEASRERFARSSAEDREALLRFVGSL